jgi:putative PIN family toxin of toxin-antitoxin system
MLKRVVFDTNIVISGRLWSGSPRVALDMADAGLIKAIMTEELVDELISVIERPKFAKRLGFLGRSPQDIVSLHLNSVEMVETAPDVVVEIADPKDVKVIACAVGGNADYLVSGDPHLLRLNTYQAISIVTVNQFLILAPQLNDN